VAEWLDGAREEFERGALWYGLKSERVGERFALEVDRVVKLVSEQPELGPVVDDLPREFGVRRFSLHRFPYVVFYATEPQLAVVAVAHQRLPPKYWADRLE